MLKDMSDHYPVFPVCLLNICRHEMLIFQFIHRATPLKIKTILYQSQTETWQIPNHRITHKDLFSLFHNELRKWHGRGFPLPQTSKKYYIRKLDTIKKNKNKELMYLKPLHFFFDLINDPNVTCYVLNRNILNCDIIECYIYVRLNNSDEIDNAP